MPVSLPLVNQWRFYHYTMKSNFYFLLRHFILYTCEITLHALHYGYLEWLKYETAKLLLYTVYRTRNRKQLGRK